MMGDIAKDMQTWSPKRIWLWHHGGRDERDLKRSQKGYYVKMGVPSGSRGKYFFYENVYLPKELQYARLSS